VTDNINISLPREVAEWWAKLLPSDILPNHIATIESCRLALHPPCEHSFAHFYPSGAWIPNPFCSKCGERLIPAPVVEPDPIICATPGCGGEIVAMEGEWSHFQEQNGRYTIFCSVYNHGKPGFDEYLPPDSVATHPQGLTVEQWEAGK
jgi:hypothetical protein